MKFSFVNLFFSCFEGKKFHYIVIKINENHIYRFINNTGKIKLRDIHSKDGITEITFNYKDKNKVLDIAEKNRNKDTGYKRERNIYIYYKAACDKVSDIYFGSFYIVINY